MENMLSSFLLDIDSSELTTLGRIVNSQYDPYLCDHQVWDVIKREFPEDLIKGINLLESSVLGHKIANDLIMNYYANERVIKYHLIKNFINRNDEITFFEMNVDSSRVDLCRVNGKSIAYEIKTELDTLSRLDKQISDYLKVFEYVYVVCHKSHEARIRTILPDICGIMAYKHTSQKFSLKIVRKAVKNRNIDYKAQLRNMSSDDLRVILRELGFRKIPATRKEREKIILDNYSKSRINSIFKLSLKLRYSKQWKFVCDNFNKIMPIDLQSFFHAPVDPELIYHKNSSIV